MLIGPVARLASELGMEVFDVQKQDIHGGTVRVFLGLADRRPVTAAVAEFLEAEMRGGFLGVDRYLGWRTEIDGLIDDLRARLAALKADGATIAAFAASAKGNTLLNACRFDVTTIDYIVDDTPEKIGKFSPGNGIPIVDRERLKTQKPDYLIILAWNFTQEIIDNTPEFGGKYIIPIPEFRVV